MSLAIILCGIYYVLGLSSTTYAQPDAVFYKINGRPVMATIVNHFGAYSVTQSGTYGTDSYYAEALDLQSGEKLWKLKLTAKGKQGKNFGSASMIGQTDKYLFVYRNQLYVIDKQTGSIIAQNEYFKDISAYMPDEEVMDYADHPNYQWDDSTKSVVIKGVDGQIYSIDGSSLKASIITRANSDNFFKENDNAGKEYNEQITSVYDDGKTCITLLDDKDTANLSHDLNEFELRPKEQSVRRILYSCPSNNISASWEKLNQGIFIHGGFLVDPVKLYEQPLDSLKNNKAYNELLKRYNYTNAPMQLNNGAYIIIHRASIEIFAPVILTAISITRKTLWEVNTGYFELPVMFADKRKNTLYVCGPKPKDGSDRLREILGINLNSGVTNSIDIN